MKVIYGTSHIKRFRRPVVALGVFDGLHLGHRHILKETVKKAAAIRGTSIVITFHPHPQGRPSLYSLQHRLRLIEEFGVDVCIVIKFSLGFSRIKAEDFIKNILIDKIGAKFIYIGRNFKFGRAASGNFRLLHKLGGVFNYKIKTFEVVRFGRQPVSSTYIRKLISEGRLNAAQKLLQRPVTVLGTVVKGISLAKKLGFPTANINPHHEILPPSGVYAVKVIFNNETFHGICNIGRKPTLLSHNTEKHVEVYVFGFNKNIYGKDLEILFIKKIRRERKFASLGLLAQQIRKDARIAKKIFSRH
jgi:riboflavin kinase/FMN adenylyltransferase